MKVKLFLILTMTLLTISCSSGKKTGNINSPKGKATSQIENFFDFTVKDIDGNDFALKQLKGKKIMVVNTASECGFTSQYKDLQKLYDTYKNQNFVIIGFPSNDFGRQEPGDNLQIKKFCEQNYKVSFPMMSKIAVIGSEQSPVYQFLTQKEKNGKIDVSIRWNFQKFLINPDGTIENVFFSKTNPMSDEIQNWIKK